MTQTVNERRRGFAQTLLIVGTLAGGLFALYGLTTGGEKSILLVLTVFVFAAFLLDAMLLDESTPGRLYGFVAVVVALSFSYLFFDILRFGGFPVSLALVTWILGTCVVTFGLVNNWRDSPSKP